MQHSCQFSVYLFALTARDRIEHVALFVNQTALPWGGSKQRGDGSQQALMTIRHEEIHLGRATGADVL